MKDTIIFLLCFIAVSSTNLCGQSSYAVELIGGRILNFDGSLDGSRGGISGGIGVSMFFNKNVEVVGNAVFSKFSPGTVNIPIIANAPFIYSPYYSNGENSYSCEISIGPRFHGNAIAFVSPYLLMQGGLYILKIGGTAAVSDIAPQLDVMTQFFNLHGTEDTEMRLFGSFGIGLQISPVRAFHVNLETKFQVLAGGRSRAIALVPILASVQFPL